MLLYIGFSLDSYAREPDKYEHLWEGNLALPISQQPGPIVGFGQNIVDKNDFLGLFEYGRLKGKHQKYNTIAPSFVYGINDHSSLFVRIPIAIDFKDNNRHSSGVGDVTAQYEYMYYSKDRPTYGIMGTVVGNIGFPTGSLKKDPYTGFGSTSFFLGTTLSYLSIEWVLYGSPGITFTTSHHGNKVGNQFLYQWGFGKNIAYYPKEWILTWIIEFNGLYKKRDAFHHVIDKNSGENLLLGGFTLWFATQKFAATGSVSLPVTQHQFGHQHKNQYFFEIVLAWKFNG